MAQDQIKYKLISAKLVGSNVVSFRLEDETLVKVHVELSRVGIAIDRKNPDGTPIYNVNAGMRIDFETKDRTYFAPAPPMTTKNVDNKNADKYTS
jgi:hypothetical protein